MRNDDYDGLKSPSNKKGDIFRVNESSLLSVSLANPTREDSEAGSLVRAFHKTNVDVLGFAVGSS